MFNLQTSDGTYFANGVLVHNCDSFSQAMRELFGSAVAVVQTITTREAHEEPVHRVGGLELRGERFIDKEKRPKRRR